MAESLMELERQEVGVGEERRKKKKEEKEKRTKANLIMQGHKQILLDVSFESKAGLLTGQLRQKRSSKGWPNECLKAMINIM